MEKAEDKLRDLESKLQHQNANALRLNRAIKELTRLNHALSEQGLQPTGLSSNPSGSSQVEGSQGTIDLDDMVPEDLISELDRSPRPDILAVTLQRLWGVHGEIVRPAEILDRHRSLVPELTQQQQRIVRRIESSARLMDSVRRLLPPRSQGAAYVPERNRVLYCAYSTPMFHSNGYSIRTDGVVSGLKSGGSDVHVLARAGYPWDISTAVPKPPRERHVITRHGVQWVHRPEGNASAQDTDVYLNVAADSVAREARLVRPSVIHAASNYLNAFPALLAARRLGVPFVYEVRGLWEVTEASVKPGWDATERYALQAQLEALVACEADAVLAITQEIKDELVRRGVPGERISLLPNGVDSSSFLPLPRDEHYAKAHGIRTNVPVIGFAGSLVGYEGLKNLVQAANILRGRKVKFQVVIAGAEGVYRELKTYQVNNRLSSYVKFVGRLQASEIPRLLSCVDIVACPRLSLPVTEMVSPLKPLEAFAASKPVVLSDVAPHRTLVGAELGADYGPRGLLSAPGDPKSLANALQTLIDDAELRTEMGRAGRLWVVAERQWSDLGGAIRDAHVAATHRHESSVSAGPELGELKIGLIADEFTTETLRRSATVIPLDRDSYTEQIQDLDFVFVESAWSGNEGQWHRGVGSYLDDQQSDLRALLGLCRIQGIPSVFWNKEDPVHIERFVAAGALCDHVFTTDADMIPRYLNEANENKWGASISASSMPFYAQPLLHNPLPGDRPLERSMSYSGTFYGDRFPVRSQQLSSLLRAAQPFGLAIYDRQANNPTSPYRFPSEFSSSIRGWLPYEKVIDSYRAHQVNLNINSVEESPTMFSRRVVEIAACGGVVLSTWNRGIIETFGSAIPSTNSPTHWRALFSAWQSDSSERLGEAWRQMRTILRAHTVETALTIMARTAGIPVQSYELPTWGTEVNSSNVDEVLSQSVLPAAVRIHGDDVGVIKKLLSSGIKIIETDEDPESFVSYWAKLPSTTPRTWAEDLLHATSWGDWESVEAVYLDTDSPRVAMAAPAQMKSIDSGLISTFSDRQPTSSFFGLRLMMDPSGKAGENRGMPPKPLSINERPEAPPGLDGLRDQTVLVAGHDLKFASSYLKSLEEQGVSVLIDPWEGHNHHDEELSKDFLRRANVVLCEWGLGNAIWYSEHVRPDQRLIVRVHAQELRGPYLRKIRHASVDRYIFVSELMRAAAVASHGVPRDRTVVVPNMVAVNELAQLKHPGAITTVGMVGIVPQLKRLDRAVSVMERLTDKAPDFNLRIKGRRPEEYSWMHKRPDELAWYERCYERIFALNEKHGREVIAFDEHGDDMADWYRGIGYGISVSDTESFHLTLPDAAASGAVPVSLAWPGADLIYPMEWLESSTSHMAHRIFELAQNENLREHRIQQDQKLVKHSFAEGVVIARLNQILFGPDGREL